ncbi:hypothetical protein [Thermoflavimicrobium dichotomicum]|uniref:PrcB C-terminal n=1 Tax=Thermoflavimicrobium dichotomicum TaxID=46223 RepID=A0A1I3NNX3_9BACL|nr:hypothetical protein [Thermoflavimicrobium dichotomicum]SFJ10862.1 hypothetical protein SAMN05421852_104215 [Thermoflavimicrobium dichotomicum]
MNFLQLGKKLFVVSLVSVLLTGCSTLLNLASDNKDSKNTSSKTESSAQKANADSGDSNNNNSESEGKKANETYEEIAYQPINWLMGAPKRQPHGGVWIYTKEKHPGSLENSSLDFNKNDYLLVQISDKKYFGYDMDVTALQIIKPDLIRIVVRLEKDSSSTSSEPLAPRRYLEIKKGAIDPDKMKFIVETEQGEKLSID